MPMPPSYDDHIVRVTLTRDAQGNFTGIVGHAGAHEDDDRLRDACQELTDKLNEAGHPVSDYRIERA